MSEQRDPAGPMAVTNALLQADIQRLKDELLKAEWRIAELEAKADVDPLLDILNRRGFDRELARSLAYVKRYNANAALVFIDLDGFKSINDKHGHAAGDALLKAVVEAVRSRVRASDTVARFGGDEFAVLLWHLDEARAQAKGRELESVVSSTTVVHRNEQLSVGASAGAVALPQEGTPEQVLEAADQAMYARKREKRSAKQ